MINRLHSLLHRPDKGWDPVPLQHALDYGAHEWRSGADAQLLDRLEARIGGFAGKKVLDLGGGPGQYATAFAQRGARVTWYDVSKNYRDFAHQKARDAGVYIEFALGYMDEAARNLDAQFDLVFNRICWYYCISDAGFARVVFDLVKPGGWAYIDSNHSGVGRESVSAAARARLWLNDRFAIKIGHPFPPRGRIARLFLDYPLVSLSAEFEPRNDRVWLQKQDVTQ
jgi:SAM-dependent methyltransferase